MNTNAEDGNPLLEWNGLPAYDRIHPEHVVPAVRHAIGEMTKHIEQLESNIQPTWEDLVVPLEVFSVTAERTIQPVIQFLGVQNSKELRDAYETVQAEIVTIQLRIKQSTPIYSGLKVLKEGDEWNRLDDAQKRTVELLLRKFEHAGVGLEGAEKERFNEIATELAKLSNDFSNNVLDATKAFEMIITDPADIEGWPQTLRMTSAQSYNSNKKEGDAEATPDNGPWRITLDHPSFFPFLQHSLNRGQRETVYRAYITRASSGEFDNTGLIDNILRLRKEKVALLGYDTFAALSLSDKMAENVGAVRNMFTELREAASQHAIKDFEELTAFAHKSGQTEILMNWDVAFCAERLREQRFDYTDDDLRPYFPLERVLEGLFTLSNKLFCINIIPADGDAPIWHEDVRYFNVLDKHGDRIASFYLDPYTRPKEKGGGAWMSEVLERRHIDGRLQLPVANLCCNGTLPVNNTPSLMSFNEVETLFHEFGHGLQLMLTTVEYNGVSGLNGIEMDAIELASQFMQNWCYHKPTLLGMTGHYETGDPLPEELFEKVKAARNFRAGSNFIRQLVFGMVDMYLHDSYDLESGESPSDVYLRTAGEISVPPPLEEDRSLSVFRHIFASDYAAGYYVYKWSEILSADAFAAFEEAGLDNEAALAEAGRKFCDTILSLGGSRPAMEIFRQFRGREPETEALLRHNGLAGMSRRNILRG